MMIDRTSFQTDYVCLETRELAQDTQARWKGITFIHALAHLCKDMVVYLIRVL